MTRKELTDLLLQYPEDYEVKMMTLSDETGVGGVEIQNDFDIIIYSNEPGE